jgi:hypothetical protein
MGIDQLSVKASLTRINTQPISVYIDHIDVDLYEATGPHTRSPKPTATPARRSYGMTERITDGIRVEVNEVRVRVRLLGRRKCPQVGPWSPPDGVLVLRKVRLFSTDEEGVEGDLEDCWRFNKGRSRRADPDYVLFKRLTVESVSYRLLPLGGPSGAPVLLIRDTPLEAALTLRRRLYDVSKVLALEVDIRMDRLRARLADGDASLGGAVAHIVAILQCISSVSATPPPPEELSTDDLVRDSDLGLPSGRMPPVGPTFEEEGAVGAEGGEDDDDGDEASEGSDDSGFLEGGAVSELPELTLPLEAEAEGQGLVAPLAPAGEAASSREPRPRVVVVFAVGDGEVKAVEERVGGWVLAAKGFRLESIRTELGGEREGIVQVSRPYTMSMRDPLDF